ncbi:hypothetical protein EDC94DRAFT_582960 [Helicostylum pulchrum]|nr:hypothetical protein EDC94DRAFT_582960 [Helicostylum pulchrum]
MRVPGPHALLCILIGVAETSSSIVEVVPYGIGVDIEDGDIVSDATRRMTKSTIKLNLGEELTCWYIELNANKKLIEFKKKNNHINATKLNDVMEITKDKYAINIYMDWRGYQCIYSTTVQAKNYFVANYISSIRIPSFLSSSSQAEK